MAEDFLFELGLEEMPAHVVTPAMEQLKERCVAFLANQRLAYESIDMFSTPRRLALRVNQLAEKQADIEEEAKGPALRIAKDEQGEWTKAAIGFAKGQGMTTADLYTKEIKGEDYVFVKKFIPGQDSLHILMRFVDEVVKKMTFPTMMRWGSENFKFIRPLHWMVALYGEQIVPLELLTIGATNVSQGHRFLGKNVVINHPKQYEKALLMQYVIVEPERRKTMIMEQMVEYATRQQWKIDFDEELLEEVNNLVEWPTAFVGNFDPKYLDIPAEVLITSMKEHQRYFDVMDYEGNLLPHFISVRNGNAEHIEAVILGNEKVLTARLEDAEFFYKEDQKHTIAENMEKLQQVTFHEKIGSMTNKMARTKEIVAFLADQWHLSTAEKMAALRASEIYKFDLVSGMVGEFSELQGVMGEKYALLQGEDPAVATAIREHYMPITAEGNLPKTKVGALLAVADKLDSLMSFFTVGLIPNGSNDPYALRRQAYGIVRILNEQNWTFAPSWFATFKASVQSGDGFKYTFAEADLVEFMQARMNQWLVRQNIRNDVIEAVLHSEADDFSLQLAAAQMLQKHLADADMKAATESFTRIANLAQKLEVEQKVCVDLFADESEQALYDAFNALNFDVNIEENYLALKGLEKVIARYFDCNMIMVDEEAVKNNRLALLASIDHAVKQIADMKYLLVK